MPPTPIRPVRCRRCTRPYSSRPSARPRARPTASCTATLQVAHGSPVLGRAARMAPDADAAKSAKRADPFAPLTSEMLAVGDGHEVYVESIGHADGIPVVYLHGGPGSG